MWSFLVLSGTAMYIIERPADTPLTRDEVALCRYLDDVTPQGDVIAPWNTGHAFEWLMQAGELRLWLQDGWEGQWDTLGMEALTRDYVAVLNAQV